ncbi:MAG: flagellar hook-length control protein FliK [Planctomycetota bacterium]|jgi:hypothetical protein
MTDIQFPYISVSAKAPRDPAFSAGASYTATVEKVLGESRYVLNVRGFQLEATLPYYLRAGDRVNVLVREATESRVLIDVSPLKPAPTYVIEDAQISDLLKMLNLSARGQNVLLVREFLRQGAPIEPNTLSSAIDVAGGDAARTQAAAFLAARGIEPTEDLVSLLAKLTRPPPGGEAGASENPVLSVLRSLALLESGTEEGLRASFGPSPFPQVHGTLGEVLDANGTLRTLDRAIEILDRSLAVAKRGESGLSRLETARRAASLVRDMMRGEIPEEVIREPADVLRDVRLKLLDAERAEMQREQTLADARANRGTLLESFDRAQGFRMVNQLLTLRDEGTALVEVPVGEKGRRTAIPVRIMRRQGGRKGGGGGRTAVTVETNLSRLGRVRAHIEAKKKTLSVRFSVRDRDVRAHMETGVPELREALREAGFESTIRVDVARLPDEPLHFPTAGGASYTMIDVKA